MGNLSYTPLQKLQKRITTLMQNTLAPSTKSSYQRAFHKYQQFCLLHHLQAAPIIEYNLMLYVSQLSIASSPSNIKTHLAAIKHHVVILGFHSELPPLPRLYMLTRAIKREYGTKHNKPPRLPITITSLGILKQYISIHYSYHDQIMLWAAFTTAFFGFLRSSEYTAPTAKQFDPSQTLLISDLSQTNGRILINVKASKTDPFRHGCYIRLSPTHSEVCPVSALNKLYSIHSKQGPLFTFQDQTFLTRRRLNNILKKALPSRGNQGATSSHSFRIGAATTAAAAGFPKWLIQHLGRWNSDCFRTYIRIPDQTIDTVAKSLSTTMSSSITFDPDFA